LSLTNLINVVDQKLITPISHLHFHTNHIYHTNHINFYQHS